MNRARSAAEGALVDLREELAEPTTDRLDELVARVGLVGVADSLPDATFVELPQAVARHLVPLASPLVVIDGAGRIRVSNGEEASVLVAGPEDLLSFAASVLAFEPDSIFVVKADRDLPWRQVDEVLDAVARAKGRGLILLADSSPEAPVDESFPSHPGGLFLLRSSRSGWSWPEPVAAWFGPRPSPVEPRATPSESATAAPPPRRAAPPRALPVPEEPTVEEPAEPDDSGAAEAPRPSEVNEEPVLVQGEITKPVPIDAPTPRYTEAARRARIQGVVILQLVIEENGTVRSAQVLKGLPMGLSEAAVEAVRQWRFRPAMRDGEPVVVTWNLTVRFEL